MRFGKTDALNRKTTTGRSVQVAPKPLTDAERQEYALQHAARAHNTDRVLRAFLAEVPRDR